MRKFRVIVMPVLAVLLTMGWVACQQEDRDYEALARQYVDGNRESLAQGLVTASIEAYPRLRLVGVATLEEKIVSSVAFTIEPSPDRDAEVVVWVEGRGEVEAGGVTWVVSGRVPFLMVFEENGDAPVSISVVVERVDIALERSLGAGN